MQNPTPDAGTKLQRALDELCCARKLSLGFLIVSLLATVGAAFSAARSEESAWLLMAAPLSCVGTAFVLWSSCQQRIRAKQRELLE